MEKTILPPYSLLDKPIHHPKPHRRYRRSQTLKFLGLGCLLLIAYSQWIQLDANKSQKVENASRLSIEKLQGNLATCSKLQHKPKDPSGSRERNARFIDGHTPTLIKNATVWIGEPVKGTTEAEAQAGKGYGWINSDVLLQYGLIVKVAEDISEDGLPEKTQIWNAEGRQLTAGIIDMHSHTGVYGLPGANGNQDTNELSNDITPQMRSIDGLDPLDPQLQVIKSGGGSGNNMGGEAFLIKMAVGKPDGRAAIGPRDMLADPEQNWRYMKMACGENAKRVYGKIGHGPFSRLGESWEFRHAFEQARSLISTQDDWCSAASSNGVESMKEYLPLDLKWESLAAALRGQVHINTHCYTIADLEAFVDHTNEFEFAVRAFHHAHETYLVPEILKRAWGGRPPAAALFADNMYYKIESYRGSEQAGKVLYENGITPVYVSDNPVINAQHVVFEAAKAYGYGLPYHAAIASVTTAPAELLGMGERIGKIKAGFDADIVVWDSDPLSVGAAPLQVWIDGTAQYEQPTSLNKTLHKPVTPNLDLAAEIIAEPTKLDHVVFTGVTKMMLPDMEQTFDTAGNVIITNGKITCAGPCTSELQIAASSSVKTISLKNGHLTHSFLAFGSSLGVTEIAGEDVTQNGPDTDSKLSRAIDGLQFTGKHFLASYAHGVTSAISAPAYTGGGQHGVSTGFSLGASNALQEGAVWADEVALHYTLTLATKNDNHPSISTSIAALRSKLLSAIGATNLTAADRYEESYYLSRVVNGSLPLVITVHSADTISALLLLKRTIESQTQTTLNLVILGGAESYLIASELQKADVPVVLAPLLSYAVTWDQRRALTGAPLTNGTAIDILLEAGVDVGIGTTDGETWEVRSLGLLAGTVFANGKGRISEKEALELVSKRNFEKILGFKEESKDVENGDFVVWEGSPLEIGGRVKAVGTLGRIDVY